MTIIFLVLLFAIILVNGWTDAPNAIATCVATRSLSPVSALALAAVCNFIGSILMALINSSVAKTVFGIASFPEDRSLALFSLCAAMSAVVIWSLLATRLGLPTSESHALISGLAGAAVAASSSLSAINTDEALTVIYGLLLSTIPAFIIARIIYSVMISLLKHRDRRGVIRYFTRTQIFSAATSATLHGAQDSQKFMGVLMLGISLYRGTHTDTDFTLPVGVIVSCAAIMTLGTLLGGKSIIKKVGLEMVSLDAAGGTAAALVFGYIAALLSNSKPKR